MARKREPWEYTAGEKPHSVTVYEREAGGPLYVRIWDATLRGGRGSMVRKSLKHADREKAREYAGEQAAKLAKGRAEIGRGQVTLKDVFVAYETFRTPRKSESEQQADARRIELWTRILGADSDPHTVTLRVWESFVDRRTSGEIDGRGRAAKMPRAVRARSVEADCAWLGWVFGWASRWRTERGTYLMRENPVRGFERPDGNASPRRPVATQDRYEAVRAKSDDVQMETRWEEKRKKQRSYLSEVLDIAHGTGRRVSAICSLTYADLRLNEGPHGAIRWPADTDKMGRESVVPIGPLVRAALDRALRERPGIGVHPVFPSPDDRTKAIRYELASDWLREAEKLAKVEKQDGSLWHAYRRGWATARKEMPDVDVAAAGGWRGVEMLKRIYQQPDAATMLRVVTEPVELREAR